MNIIISGALGRMGKTLAEAAKASGTEVVCGVDTALREQTAEFPLVKTCEQIPCQADVIIDFSVAENLNTLLNYALQTKTALVLCVTGYSDRQLRDIQEASRQIPILRGANMSFGIQVLAQLAAAAARILGKDYDIEIVEKHHNKKADSPSGTALMLSAAMQKELGGLSPVFGRHGKTGERGANEIGIHAVRGGTVSGEHEVGFYGDAEEIILTHRAENRALFARGALRGAAFLVEQPPGLYTLGDAVADLIG
ncbi:MAG: 4-hydroxy-tetrahydrodipicolinate reductase [Clostridiales bacterium]|nr:4-hydroxy-tetrahydrodipicolinate reductase [Clostridiales bacterium]